MAKKQAAAGQTKVRVLCDCAFGRADEVAVLNDEDLAAAVGAGHADPHPDAVAYAESMAADEPAADAAPQ